MIVNVPRTEHIESLGKENIDFMVQGKKILIFMVRGEKVLIFAGPGTESIDV